MDFLAVSNRTGRISLYLYNPDNPQAPFVESWTFVAIITIVTTGHFLKPSRHKPSPHLETTRYKDKEGRRQPKVATLSNDGILRIGSRKVMTTSGPELHVISRILVYLTRFWCRSRNHKCTAGYRRRPYYFKHDITNNIESTSGYLFKTPRTQFSDWWLQPWRFTRFIIYDASQRF